MKTNLHELMFFLRVDHGELEDDVLVGQRVVDSGEGFQLGLSVYHVLRVQVDLKQLGSIRSKTSALAHNLSGVHNILQNALLHAGKSSGAGAHALLRSTSIHVLRLHCALGNNHDMTATIVCKKGWKQDEKWKRLETMK